MPSPREPQPQLWTVWPGHDFDTTEHLDLQEQVTSMAWDILDPTPYHTYQEYKQALQAAKPGQELFSLGVVLDDTVRWQPARKDGKLQRSVRWLYTSVPRNVMKPRRI